MHEKRIFNMEGKNKMRSILWGITFIICGILIGLDFFNIINIFPGIITFSNAAIISYSLITEIISNKKMITTTLKNPLFLIC